MQIQIISAHKTKDKNIKGAEEEFQIRLPSHIRLEVKELNCDKFAKLPDKERIKKETELIISSITKLGQLVVLDEKGKEYSSITFAKFLESKMVQAVQKLTFVIGGPYGIGDELKERAGHTISLSKLTLPYQLARLVLMEQIYRAFTIINNSNYHK